MVEQVQQKEEPERFVFEGDTDIQHLRVLGAIAKETDCLPLVFDRTGLKLRVLDPSRITLFDWSLQRLWHAPKYGGVSKPVTLDADEVADLFRKTLRLAKGTAHLRATTAGVTLVLKHEDGYSTTHKLLTIGSLPSRGYGYAGTASHTPEDYIPPPELSASIIKRFTIRVWLTAENAKVLAKFLRDYAKYAACCIQTGRQGITVSTVGGEDSNSVTLPLAAGVATKAAGGKLALDAERLKAMLTIGALMGAKTVCWEFGNTTPIRMTYESKENGSLVIFIAPRVTDD